MSDYEPFEAAQGDPWSTEPVGDNSRPRRDPDPETYQDDSQVMARMPHVADDADQYRQHGHGSSNHRRRRSSSQRPGIPAPVWVAVGMVLVVVIAIPFLMSGKSGDDGWQAEMPAPDADEAPTWSPGDTTHEWQPPSEWPQEATTVTAEPIAPGAMSPPDEWDVAQPSGPYAYDADTTTPMPVNQSGGNYGTEMTANGSMPMPPFAGQGPGQPPVGWDTSVAPPVPTPHGEANYQAMGSPSQPTYPAAPSAGTTQAMPNTNTWNQGTPSPSFATPQPQNVMPGYGAHAETQPNGYAGNPYATTADSQGGYTGRPVAAPTTPQPYPSAAPSYPVAGQPSAALYPVPAYPQTASRPPAPKTSPQATGSPYPYPSQPVRPTTYPAAARNPYTPQPGPATPPQQPYYGTGASTTAAPQASVARLNGTIHEPATRAAYDDRARPSYY